jgi:hypothetical protein
MASLLLKAKVGASSHASYRSLILCPGLLACGKGPFLPSPCSLFGGGKSVVWRVARAVGWQQHSMTD